MPKSPQTKEKFTAVTITNEIKISTWSSIFRLLVTEKNSITISDKTTENPANIPRAFQEPNKLPTLEVKMPNDKALGKNNRKIWKTKTMAAENTVPSKTILALLESLKTIEDINIKIKPEKMNQKVPMSNIVPKNEAWRAPEKMAERKTANTMPRPPSKQADRGKVILPSENRAMAQEIMEMVNPTTKSNPFEISTGTLVKGKKKTGNNTIIKNSDKNEMRSKIFELIGFIILHVNYKNNECLYHNVDKSVFNVNYSFNLHSS